MTVFILKLTLQAVFGCLQGAGLPYILQGNRLKKIPHLRRALRVLFSLSQLNRLMRKILLVGLIRQIFKIKIRSTKLRKRNYQNLG
jgi:hypothetical protein